MRKSDLVNHLPERIQGLARLAYNLWWSWHPRARDLFRALDVQAWRESGHNPVRMLATLQSENLEEAAADKDFLAHYDSVMAEFEADTGSPSGWFGGEYGRARAPLAYFSAEYGLHVSLPVYAGGLGILAGDYLKECSDLAIPLVAVGLIYSEGYVSQRIGEDGWQEDVEETLDRTYDPISPVLGKDGQQITVEVPIFDPPVHVAVWQVEVGRIPLYLLDTDIDANQPWDRAIAHRLYASNPEQRLRQEIVLGMGGMRALEALGIHPAALHLNEGHPALAVLERVRALVDGGAEFDSALDQARRTSMFTTHTPVPAGTDIYPFQLMEQYIAPYCQRIGLDRDELYKLGINPQKPSAGFNMTVFALRVTSFSNAVSQKHGQVAREMWSDLWPDRAVEDVPIVAITNGVHLAAWIDPIRLQALLTQHLGLAWLTDQDRPGIWEVIEEIPDEELWDLHHSLKVSLITDINERVRARWQKDKIAANNVVALGGLLDPEVLTIGFARRFTDYKRPDLILSDIERFKRLLTDPWHPLQIIFAGKAHPADAGGKRLIQKIFRLAQDPEFGGRIAFVEDYEQQLAEYMVHGVDVWLNNPIPPQEASGTSGMKAAINGVPNLSILDGWWIEGYNGENGWAFGGEEIEGDRTAADAKALYDILEQQVIPLYYERSDNGVPRGFVQVMKCAIESVAPRFGTRRMAKEYVKAFYVDALGLNT
jgi:starch phosphorylase